MKIKFQHLPVQGDVTMVRNINPLALAEFIPHNRPMLLINPPVAKPCEPPAGIARLAGALRAQGAPCRLLDASLEGLLWLMEQSSPANDTWTKRARAHRERHCDALRDPAIYGSPDRYIRAVNDLNRLLAVNGRDTGATVGLADFQHARLSPVRSADLLYAAARPEENPFHPWFKSRLQEFLADSTSPCTRVGFSLNYLSQALCTFAMIGHLRERYPEITIILGGGLVTSWLKSPGWNNPFAGLVDHLIAGAGELPLLALSGIQVPVSRHTIPDFDDLPLRKYLAPGFILPYSAASGCYWNRCTFCPEKAEGNSYLPLPAGEVLGDLRSLTAATQPVLLHLLDSAVSPALLRALAAAPPQVPWYGFARMGPELADPGFCRSLRRSGCVMLKLGLESGDQEVLDRMGKGIRLDIAAQVLENLQQAGIAIYLYLLFGTPAESAVEARRTLEFVVRHRESIGFFNAALFNMPVGSDETAVYETEPFYDGDLSLYTGFRHPRGWGRKEARRFLDGEFRRDLAIAAILRNDPPFFTSNHAPFFSGITT